MSSRIPVSATSGDLNVERLAFGRLDVARLLDISTRTLDRLLATGAFPAPDRHAGRKPLWAVSTIEKWIHGDAPTARKTKKGRTVATARPEEPRPDVSKHETRSH